jgi:17 kDa outer membrane surface antigen/Putative zinc-finger
MTAGIDFETLMAYADGELDAEGARRVEAHLARDAGAAKTVRDLREGTALVRGAYQGLMREKMPDALRARVEGMLGAAVDDRRVVAFAPRARLPQWAMRAPVALAASVAALAVGFLVIYQVLDWRLESEMARLETMRAEDQKLLAEAVTQALERQISGAALEWRNPQSGSRGAVTPVRTFRNTEGQWCREYAKTATFSDRVENWRGIACRDADGVWRELALYLPDA